MTGTVAHIKHFLSKSYIEFSGFVTKTLDLTTTSSDGQFPQQAPGKIHIRRIEELIFKRAENIYYWRLKLFDIF